LKTQLLCTFAHRKDLDLISDYITKSYTVAERRIFVFADADNKNDLYLTYNIERGAFTKTPNTISIHRKKETNTLYTVNALNTIIVKANNGVLDKTFVINWEAYRNTLLLTSDNDLRPISLELMRRIDL
jgi:hypothetical protein|tara:strand:- start:309 stop:695 length:387 start_codon:yes stop_codon:yes gene_type:complete